MMSNADTSKFEKLKHVTLYFYAPPLNVVTWGSNKVMKEKTSKIHVLLSATRSVNRTTVRPLSQERLIY